MTGVFVKNCVDVAGAACTIKADDAAHAVAVAADRVAVACEEEQRQVARGAAEGRVAVRARAEDEQIAEGGGGEDKVALFVRLIERNDLFVAAEPVKDRIGVVDPAVVGLEGDAVQQAAAEGHAARACDGVCDMSRAEGGGVRAGGADEDRACKLRAALGQAQADDERAHGMTEHEIGQVGIAAVHQLAQVEYVLNEVFPAVVRGEKAEVSRPGDRSAVADVVVAADDEAEAAEIFGKGSVAREIFAHAVADLNDAADMGVLGHENVVGDIGNAVRAFINILSAFYIHKPTSDRRNRRQAAGG